MSTPDRAPATAISTLRLLPRTVWALGAVSLLMDTSSELIHSLLPVFMVSTLGASAVAVGFIEGVAEATAMVTKVFSGLISDWFGKRKPLALLGYGLAAFTKPLFPLATSLAWVMTARFTDRVGKGIRGAPRDALVADITPKSLTGAAYGLRQALDTVGAVGGPLLAMVFMFLLADRLRAVLWIGVLPALLCVVVLAFGVEEPDATPGTKRARLPIQRAALQRLGAGYWFVVVLGGVFTLARFSQAFLVLRAQSVAIPLAEIPLVIVVMNAVYALVSYPVGYRADRMDRRQLLAVGLVMLVVADWVLAKADGPTSVYAGAALWGLHFGFTEGVLAAMVADAAPGELRGTAFGLFNLVTGTALLIASGLAGELWEHVGPAATFYAGAGFSLVALVGLVGVKVRKRA